MSLVNFGERVKELRKQQGISQEELAKIAEVDRSYICGVETGKRNISLENIEKITKALGVSLETFFSYDTIVSPQIIFLSVNGEQFALRSDKELTRRQKDFLELLCKYCYDDDEEGVLTDKSNFEMADWFIEQAKVELGVTFRYVPIDEEYRIRK